MLYRTIGEFCSRKGISFAKICFNVDGCEKLFKSSRCYASDSQGTVCLDLTSKPSDLVWKNLPSKQRQEIRKLEKNGFEVREAASKADLKTFLSLYYKNMRHLGVPGYRPDFFENVWDLLYPQNFTILFAQMKAPLAGLGFFKYNKTIYLTYLGMDRESLQRAPAIAPFLFWKTINWAETNDFTTVCFGSTPAHPQSSIDKTNYSQKMIFCGAFHPQEIVYVPFDFHSYITFLVAPKSIRFWKSMRDLFPPRLQKAIENRLGNTFER